jgi:CubicO group peptidase (beta-lactamase class C family)
MLFKIQDYIALCTLWAGIMTLTLVSFSAPTIAADTPPEQNNIDTKIDEFRNFIEAYKKEKRIVSLSASIGIGNKVIYSEGFGWQDHDAEEPTTTDTSYLVASISKTFSAATLLRMEEDGIINLDDDFTKLSDWDRRCKWLTGSGIIFGGGTLDDGTPVAAPKCDTAISLRHVLQHRVQGTPGTSFFYNPIIFGRLSNWVEEQTGKPFDHWVDKYVLAPGGLDNIAAGWRDADKSHVLTHLAPAFKFDQDRGGRPALSVGPNPEMNASSGIIASTESLVRYSIALDEGRILSPALREKMWRPPIDITSDTRSDTDSHTASSPGSGSDTASGIVSTPSSGTPAPYANGWYVENWKDNRLVWHSGWWPDAYAGYLVKAPDKKITLAIFANTDGLWTPTPLNAGGVHASPVVEKFLELFVE